MFSKKTKKSASNQGSAPLAGRPLSTLPSHLHHRQRQMSAGAHDCHAEDVRSASRAPVTSRLRGEVGTPEEDLGASEGRGVGGVVAPEEDLGLYEGRGGSDNSSELSTPSTPDVDSDTGDLIGGRETSSVNGDRLVIDETPSASRNSFSDNNLFSDEDVPSDEGFWIANEPANMEFETSRAFPGNDQLRGEYEQNADVAVQDGLVAWSENIEGNDPACSSLSYIIDETLYFDYQYLISLESSLVKTMSSFDQSFENSSPNRDDFHDHTLEPEDVPFNSEGSSGEEGAVSEFDLSLCFEYQLFTLRDDEIAKKLFVLTPGFLNFLKFRDGRQRKIVKTVSIDVHLDSFQDETDQSITPPLVDILFPENFYALHWKMLDTRDQKKMLADLVRILNTIVENKPNLPWNNVGVVYALVAQGFVIRNLTKKVITKKYIEGFGSLLDRLGNQIKVLQLSLEADQLPTSFFFRDRWNAFMSRVELYLAALGKWNAWESFLAGKSPKFDNIKKYTDFLPDSETPLTCVVCLVATVDENCDFAVLGDCDHLFCSPCIEKWFNEKTKCPLCCRSTVWMSRSHFEYYVLPKLNGA